MSDLISRQAAIDATRNATFSFTIKSDIDFANYRKEIQEIFNNVIDAQEKALNELPSAQPETHDKRTETHACDLIGRQEAIDAHCELCPDQHICCPIHNGNICPDIEVFRLLPSAQPEIIRCTECKHYREYDSKYVENAVVVQCMADRYPISEIIPDGWFCAGAERKDDE